MPTSRDRILARISDGLAKNRAALEAEAARAPHLPPQFVHPAEDDLPSQFAGELAKLAGTTHHCADDEAAIEAIGAILRGCGATEVIAWDEGQIGLPGLHALYEMLGIAVAEAWIAGEADPAPASRRDRLQRLEPAQVCISGADAAIAESGTLVLAGGTGRPRLASLLAPVYIAVVRREQLVRGLGEALELLHARHGEDVLGARSSVTLITGPSRTGDIELTLTLGVHGPAAVHVVLIG